MNFTLADHQRTTAALNTEVRPLRLWLPVPLSVWALLSAFVIFSLAYNFIQPPFEMSDEREHFGYVRYLVEQRSIPVFVPGESSEYHQPPLYYLVAALLFGWLPADDRNEYRLNPYSGYRHWEPGVDNKNMYLHGPWDRWPFRDTSLAVHVARLSSLLMCAMTVLAVYQAARALLPEAQASAATGLVAFTPMFVSVSGSVQNDAGAALLGALILWLALRCFDDGFTVRRALLLGVAVGVGGLMKLTAAIMLVPATALLIFYAEQERWSWPRTVRHLGALALGAVLGGGWWYGRNWLLFGEPTSLGANLATYANHDPLIGFRWWRDGLAYAWTTFWARIGWGDLHLPEWIYQWLALLVVIAVIGLARQWPAFNRPMRAKVVALLLAVLVSAMALIGYITFSPTGAQGRYAYPSLAAFATLIVLGLCGLIPARRHSWLRWLAPAAMAAFATFTFFGVLIPVYLPPPTLTALPTDATSAQANLGQVAEIKGYAVSATHVRPGERVTVTVYWRPLQRTAQPYSVFLHLLTDESILIAQRDSYPGLGRLPTHGWEPGQMFADEYQVIIPADAPTPQTATWLVGMWQAETGERAWLLDTDGQPADVGFRFGQLVLSTHP